MVTFLNHLLQLLLSLTYDLRLLALSNMFLMWKTRSWSRKIQHQILWCWKRWIPFTWSWLGSLWCGRRKKGWIFIFFLWRVFIRGIDEGRDMLSLSRIGYIAWFTLQMSIPLSFLCIPSVLQCFFKVRTFKPPWIWWYIFFCWWRRGLWIWGFWVWRHNLDGELGLLEIRVWKIIWEILWMRCVIWGD